MACAGDVMGAELLQCEFSVLRWTPNPVRGEFANVGVILREVGGSGRMLVRFARSWRRARAVDDGFDAELMNELAAELAYRLAEKVQDKETRPLLEVMLSSFSNDLTITEPQACLASGLEAEIGRLMRMYVEPVGQREPRRVDSTGRSGLVRGMQREFEQAGVWALMRHGIPAAEYTAAGDRLRIDCGYRAEDASGAARMFHAVSLATEVDAAKVLAFSAAQLKEGVRRVDGASLELTAVVEAESVAASASGYRFAVTAMEEAAIRVVTTAEMAKVAETARRELRV